MHPEVTTHILVYLAFVQCCGSGSVGSIWFLTSWIRILLSSSKNSKKNLDSYCFCDFFLNFYLWKIITMYLQKVISRKTFFLKLVFCWRLQGPDPDPLEARIRGPGSVATVFIWKATKCPRGCWWACWWCPPPSWPPTPVSARGTGARSPVAGQYSKIPLPTAYESETAFSLCDKADPRARI